MAKKLFVFELFYSEEEAALRGTPIAVYESAPVDAEIERLNGKLEAAEELAAAAMADLKALRGADEPSARTFDQFPVGTLFQKKSDGRVLAMLPDGETVRAREPLTYDEFWKQVGAKGWNPSAEEMKTLLTIVGCRCPMCEHHRSAEKSSATPDSEYVDIEGPSSLCGLLGCKRQTPHHHKAAL